MPNHFAALATTIAAVASPIIAALICRATILHDRDRERAKHLQSIVKSGDILAACIDARLEGEEELAKDLTKTRSIAEHFMDFQHEALSLDPARDRHLMEAILARIIHRGSVCGTAQGAMARLVNKAG